MNKKMNTKGWIRIIEALFAILIVTGGVLVVLSNRIPEYSSPEEIYEKQMNILNIISKNNSLRDKIIDNNDEEVKNAIQTMIPNNWNFTTNICNINEICNTGTPNDRDVYVSEIIITSTLQKYEPKKLRFFVWMK